MAPPVFKTGLAANIVAGGFDSLPPPPLPLFVILTCLPRRILILPRRFAFRFAPQFASRILGDSKGEQMKSFVIGAVGLCLLPCVGCSSHDASDPSYGAMFKQTTRDRVSGNEFWGSRTEKDCTGGGVWEVCTPVGQNGPPQ